MFYPHTRQLQAQPGVQLNPLRDNTDGFSPQPTDQAFAVVGRFKRGRIDAPFRVNRGNLKAKLGTAESLRLSALNEAYVQTSETLDGGAYEAVVVRLTTPAAANGYAAFVVGVGGTPSAFPATMTVPLAPFVFHLQMLDCFNDGYRFEVAANKTLAADGVASVPAKVITLRIREPNNNLLYEFTGSLDPLAVDEHGKDYFIGSVIESQTDLVKITVAADADIPITADCYGRNPDGTQKTATSGVNPVVLFAEGGTGYIASDYDAAVAKLENGSVDFGYIIGGGSQAVALLSKLGALAVRSNRQFAYDVPGNLTPAAAAAFVGQLNFDSHYIQAYWAPLLTDDPVNGGKAYIGTSGYNVGLRCARNAQTNAYGLAPKNYPVAGKDWPLARTGVKQMYSTADPELSDLANAKINPVIFQRYNDGGKFVFSDSITSAKVNVSYRKLISVSEMSATIDDMVAKFGREVLQLPMDAAIKRTEAFLKATFDGCRASDWFVASNDPALGEKGYTFSVKRNNVRPADRMDVTYGCHYDGVVRAIHITQTLSR
ncbi:MAG: hypothetical protein WKG03_19930 [Telluria sp.]